MSSRYVYIATGLAVCTVALVGCRGTTPLETRDDSSTEGISGFCEAVSAEVSQIPTQVEIQIKQCEIQQGYTRPVLVIGLNYWLDWIDFSDVENIPYGEGIDDYIFNYPLQLVINGLRNSSLSLEDFEGIYIALNDEQQTVYELSPFDVQQVLNDPRDLKTVLRELRNKIKISGL